MRYAHSFLDHTRFGRHRVLLLHVDGNRLYVVVACVHLLRPGSRLDQIRFDHLYVEGVSSVLEVVRLRTNVGGRDEQGVEVPTTY